MVSHAAKVNCTDVLIVLWAWQLVATPGRAKQAKVKSANLVKALLTIHPQGKFIGSLLALQQSYLFTENKQKTLSYTQHLDTGNRNNLVSNTKNNMHALLFKIYRHSVVIKMGFKILLMFLFSRVIMKTF